VSSEEKTRTQIKSFSLFPQPIAIGSMKDIIAVQIQNIRLSVRQKMTITSGDRLSLIF